MFPEHLSIFRQNILTTKLSQTGELLAILQEGAPVVLLWSVAARRIEVLEVSSKDPSWLGWSPSGAVGGSSILAVGTGKGGLLLYHKRTLKKQTVICKNG